MTDPNARPPYGYPSDQPTSAGGQWYGASAPPPAYQPPPASAGRRRRKRRWGCFSTALAIMSMALVAVLGAVGIAGLVIYNSLAGELQQDIATLEAMSGVENFQTSRIYDRDGVLLYEIFSEGRRTEVPLDRIPFAMRWAIIATEDDSFYDNPGFDPPSIARAAWQWLSEGEVVSGGSTITQQLVRQIVFSYEERNEQTLRRKLKEAALAWVMTQRYTKDEILELYLNEVYYGNLAYGVESAADVYFGKHASELTVAEAAFLAGLVQSPATYDPYTNFAEAKLRQRQVLDLMVLHGYITAQDADIAFNEPPRSVADLANPDVSLLAPHFTVEVRRQLGELIDPALLTQGGLEIYTTLDMDYQTLAEQIVAQRVAEVRDEYNLHNAALVALNPNTGEVLAMVGSVNYADETIDGNVNVTLSLQQPGSAMKPLTYAAAFEQGWLPADIIWDVPMAYGSGDDAYRPANYDGRFHGPVRLRDALANSYNIPAVTLLREVGVPALLEMASRLGVESLGMDASQYGLSLTLGGGELTPLELTTAYAAFANGGRRVTPILISRVVDSNGNILYQAPSGVGEQVLDPRIAFLISDILSDNAARTPMMGADSALRLDFPAAAKTGTTNDYRDNWTVGYTPHLVVGVWAGNTDNSPMAEGTSGLTGAAPIWHDFMTAVYAQPDLAARLEAPGLPPLRSEFTPPTGLEQRPVCVLSSLTDPAPAEAGCPRTRLEWFPVSGTTLTIGAGTPMPEPTPTLAPTPTLTGEDGQPLPPIQVQIESGLWVLGVIPLDPSMQQTVLQTLAATPLPPEAGGLTADPPRYCEVPPEAADLAQLSLQIFIEAPSNPVDAVRARNWAYAHNVPITPGVVCPPDLLDQLRGQQVMTDPITGATYGITSPRPGQQVFGIVPITGTASFDPAYVQYYKVEISGGSLDGWITLGETHSETVADGVLEYLHADALPPGEYVIRLVLVGMDGNFLQPTFDVPITIIPPPTPTPSPS
jgi:1A family penicillin-binding protein